MISSVDAFNKMRESDYYKSYIDKIYIKLENKINKKCIIGGDTLVCIFPLSNRKRKMIFRELYFHGYEMDNKHIYYTISWQAPPQIDINTLSPIAMENNNTNKKIEIGFRL